MTIAENLMKIYHDKPVFADLSPSSYTLERFQDGKLRQCRRLTFKDGSRLITWGRGPRQAWSIEE